MQIRNRVTFWRRGTEVWRSKAVQLYSKTTVDCNATTEVTRVWDCYLLDPENGTVLETIDLSSLDSQRKSFLYVPPFFLKPGYYKFKFSINMTSPEPHPLLPFFASTFTFVKIVRSPIIAQLADGAQSRVIRGWGQRYDTKFTTSLLYSNDMILLEGFVCLLETFQEILMMKKIKTLR